VLRGQPTGPEIEATIHRTIVEVLELGGKPVPHFDAEDDLIATGLSSLDLAGLVAKLERRWKIDPFLEAKAITEVRTVGDLCRAYQEYVNTR
jgi:acyl carrier protein